jgi:hypothetical protein
VTKKSGREVEYDKIRRGFEMTRGTFVDRDPRRYHDDDDEQLRDVFTAKHRTIEPAVSA